MRPFLRLPLLLGLTFALFTPSAAAACTGDGAAVQVSRENQTSAPSASVTLAPGSSVTYNYQVEELVTTTRDNYVDEGRYVWQSKWVDRGSWVWTSNWVDEGYWVSDGYWVGAWETSSRRVWEDTGHWAWDTHRNKYIYTFRWGSYVELLDCSVHAHDSIEGDCGGHAAGFVSHWNIGKFWHDTGRWKTVTTSTWNPYATWVDTSYWQAVVVDRGSWSWKSNWVDEGSWAWQSKWVDRGSWVWQPNVVNRPITTSQWVTRPAVTAAATLPSASATLRFVGTTTYNYVEVVEGCSSPT